MHILHILIYFTTALYYIFVSPFVHYPALRRHLPPYTTTHILVLLLAIPHVFIFFPIFAYFVHMMLMWWSVAFNMPGFERFLRLSTYNNASIHEWYDQNKLEINKSNSAPPALYCILRPLPPDISCMYLLYSFQSQRRSNIAPSKASTPRVDWTR